MLRIGFLLSGAALVGAVPAHAADALRFGPSPAWVTPQSVPETKPTDAPVAVLLSDQQVAFGTGKTTTYAETVMRIQTPQGLAAGNISFSWNPATDSVTVNKLHILRGGKVIDVLAAGQTFTVLRRESNLEAAMLDGTLTANIQPEGLQEGDIIDLATTVDSSDPVLRGHSEAIFAGWNAMPFSSAHARLTWPAKVKMSTRQSVGLPEAARSEHDGTTVFELTARDVQPLVPPKGAPARYSLGRIAEVTDFDSWSDVADLFTPLFREASAIAPAGSLRQEVDRIRAASSDPKMRAQWALALVQDRVRYVALLMGQGSLVPAAAETTWSRRFGDCKAKTALLLGILHELGIEAEPVLANSGIGDAIADRLPMIGVFDHVFVRARIGGKSYWLDGTRTGDAALDRIDVPDLGWVLPLAPNATLVNLQPPPRDAPNLETKMEIDATSGIYAPSPATIEKVLRGDAAVVFQNGLSNLTEAQRQEFFRTSLKSEMNFITLKSASTAFDKANRELRISMTGDAKFDWSTGYFHVPGSSIGFSPDYERPPGPLHDAPVAVGYPAFGRTLIKIRMPQSFLAGRKLGSASVHETLAGVEYLRNTTVDGNLLTIETRERSLVPEFPYEDALAAVPRLKALSDQDVALPLPRSYRPSEKDLAALARETPVSADDYARRGGTFLDAFRFDDAIADFTKALELEPKSGNTLADRGIAYVWKGDYARAEQDLAAAFSINPNNAVIFRARGLMAQRKADHKGAVEAYTQALKIEPQNGFALGHRAESYHALGDEDKALVDAEQALKEDPDWLDLRWLRAGIFLSRDKKDAAAAEADALIADDPAATQALVGAARIYALVGLKGKAAATFDRALAIKPEAFIYLNRARSRPFTDHAGRLADLDAALKLEPDNVETLAEKAEQLAVDGDFNPALSLYNRVLKIAPDNGYLAQRRAILLYKAGSQTEAETILARRRNEAKTSGDFNGLCWSKATAGILLESALLDCREALRLKPDNGAAIDSLAFVNLRMGKLDDAIALYNQALEKKSGSASYMGRAIAYARKGDRARAEADRAQALKLDPDAETRFAEYGLKM